VTRQETKLNGSPRRRLRSLATVMAVGLSLSLSGADRPTSRQSAAKRKTSRRNIALSVPVKGSRFQSDLSPELIHDLPNDANDATPKEVTPPSASVVARSGAVDDAIWWQRLPAKVGESISANRVISRLVYRSHGLEAHATIALSGLEAGSSPFLRGLYTGAARTFTQSNGKLRVSWLEVTAYCPCIKCCGPEANGITASGKPVDYNHGAFAAADADEFPFGAKLRVPGYHEGQPIEVIDRGSAIRHAKVDVFFPTHEQAEAWGRQWIPVIVEQ
jgi:3D (Asp-Asp-Asp) domain-containing protein